MFGVASLNSELLEWCKRLFHVDLCRVDLCRNVLASVGVATTLLIPFDRNELAPLLEVEVEPVVLSSFFSVGDRQRAVGR